MIAHPPLRAFAAAVLELGALIEQVDGAQWRRGYAPARREDTHERSKGGHSDPTADTVAEPRRLALRAAVQAGEQEIALATARVEATSAALRRATEAWSGERVAPVPLRAGRGDPGAGIVTSDLRERLTAAANGYDAPDLVDEVLAAVQRRAASAVKVCGSCAEPHPLSAFGRHPAPLDGLESSCRAAEAARKRARRAASVAADPLLN